MAVAAVLSLASTSVSAAILNLYYDSVTGNLKLQNITSGSVSIGAFDIITLGNGTVGPVSGEPGNVGFMSTGSATTPTFSFPVSNQSPFGINGLYSQVGGANLLTSSPLGGVAFTLAAYAGWSPSSPIGPVGSYWDLGNIAVTGMTQPQLTARFITDPDSIGDLFQGKFSFAYFDGTAWKTNEVSDVLVAVPEPSTALLGLAAAACSGVGLAVRRRKRTG